MGYCMLQDKNDFTMKAENFDKALEAIKKLATQTDKMRFGGSFAGVDTDEFLNAKTLKEALDAWGIGIEQDGDNEEADINYIHCHSEKLGQEAVVLEAIAPYVENDSYIEMHGEDGSIWRWIFLDGKFEEKMGKLVWDETKSKVEYDKVSQALNTLYNSFVHVKGNTKGNKAKTDIIKYNDDVREALNIARQFCGY